ncbi:MAG: hypothetical protein JW889_05460 [Verrucomicrobia bacterium]|nr:hypothetical protein [Verrucomicrobiota bacterium]
MRWAMTIAAIGLAVVLAGCSSNRKAMDDLREEQRRTLGQLNRLSADLNNLRQELIRQADGLGTNIALLSSRVDMLEMGGGSTGVRSAVPDAVPDGDDDRQAIPVEARTFEELARRVAELEADFLRFRSETVASQEEQLLRDPQETFRAITDPEKISWRLDRFAKVWTEQTDDEATRQAFQADVASIEEQILSMAKMPRDEAVAHYRAKLAERSAAETNDRMRRWFDSQVQMLDRAEPTHVENQLSVFRRYDTILALKNLADKYEISADVMRDNGLPITGAAYGWE